MKLAIMQPYFFPYIGYFQLIAAVDKFIPYYYLNYKVNGWINRNRLLIVNKEPAYFTVSIKQKSINRLICDIKVDSGSPWKKNMLRTIYLNYKKAQFFEEIFPLIEKCLNTDAEYLYEINCSAIKMVSEYLDIPTQIDDNIRGYELLEERLKSGEISMREYARDGQQLPDTKSIRAVSICRHESAGTLINAIGGKAIYDKRFFSDNGINIQFINTLPYCYKQQAKDFFPNLSIIDVLMNCGKEDTKKLLNNYELV